MAAEVKNTKRELQEMNLQHVKYHSGPIGNRSKEQATFRINSTAWGLTCLCFDGTVGKKSDNSEVDDISDYRFSPQLSVHESWR